MMKSHSEMKKRKCTLVAVCILLTLLGCKYRWKSTLNDSNDVSQHRHGREILSADVIENTTVVAPQQCNQPSIIDFPRDVFTQDQRQQGAVLLHIIMAVYLFVGLAFVCDDYFTSALEKICQRLHLSEDVAGATFMAAGSSAPDFFTSIFGVFITNGDVGIGTIVGSAIFNLLAIIALCSVFAGQVVVLTRWPVMRDAGFYTISVVLLILIIYDGVVNWWEAVVMICLYAIYIVVIKMNPWIKRKLEERTQRNTKEGNKEEDGLTTPLGKNFDCVTKGSFLHVHQTLKPKTKQWTLKELTTRVMTTNLFSSKTRFCAHHALILNKVDRRNQFDKYYGSTSSSSDLEQSKDIQESGVNDSDVEIVPSPLTYQKSSILRTLFWIITLPMVLLLYFTIPDCRKKRWEGWYMVTFLLSIVWISIFTYVIVWMMVIIGFTLGIPDVIMGIVFLAAGTSVPDALASLIVAREGHGDMAVSNTIGSNVIDILIGLGVPWFLRTAVVDPGSFIFMTSHGLVYSVGLLFGSVLFTIFAIYLNKWKLDKKLGIVLFTMYLLFIGISSCIELNVFGFVNYPICPYEM